MAWARLYHHSKATTEVDDEDGMDDELESAGDGWDWEEQMVHLWQGTLQLLVESDHVA